MTRDVLGSRSITLALGLAVVAPCIGDPLPLGGEFALNSTTANGQFSPSVAMALDDTFLVAWGDNTTSNDVRGRAFDQNGAPISDDQLLNVFTTGSQAFPHVVLDSDGNWAVSWLDGGQFAGGGSDPIFRYSSDGGAVTSGEVRANSGDTVAPTETSIARPAGGVVVGWEEADDILLSFFDDAGQVVLQNVTGNATTVGLGFDLAAGAQGRTAVIYNSSTSLLGDIEGRLFDATGAPVGDPFAVDASTAGTGSFPAMGTDGDGAIAAVWISGVEVRLRLLDPLGQPRSSEFSVRNAAVLSGANVAVATDGAMVVIWQEGLDINTTDIWAREYSALGTPADDAFLVNTITTGDQDDAEVAIGGEQFVVAWESADVDSDGIWGQRFRRRSVFANGFENGTTSTWSSTAN